MRQYNVFDIMGPIMIGPSSSHTAGAARLGKIAAIIAGEGICEVTFLLHGSFAKTYKGHGTDRALVAGVLGMDPSDERLKNSFEIAKEKNIKISFEETDLGDVHPNTVKFLIKKSNNDTVEVQGSSIGGGSILITEVDGDEIEFSGEYPTIVIKHRDVPGMISKVTTVMSEHGINIAFMKVFRSKKGSTASMVFETDSIISEDLIEKIKSLGYIAKIRVINPTPEGE